MRWAPSVTVAAVIRDRDRYLMVEERPDEQAVINQPAGHLEPGESLIEAVQREVREETARAFTPIGLLGVYQWRVPGSHRSYLRFCFIGTVGERDPAAALDPDIIATHWMRYEQIVSGTLPARSPLVLRCIDDSIHTTAIDLSVLRSVTWEDLANAHR